MPFDAMKHEPNGGGEPNPHSRAVMIANSVLSDILDMGDEAGVCMDCLALHMSELMLLNFAVNNIAGEGIPESEVFEQMDKSAKKAKELVLLSLEKIREEGGDANFVKGSWNGKSQ